MRTRPTERPVLQGEIVGRRGWRLDLDDLEGMRTWPSMPVLRSSWAPRAWFPGNNQAHCIRGDWGHPAPHVRCECGLYAVYRPDDVARFLGGLLILGQGIRGLITAWGDIEAHVEGFRAEHARVAALVDEPYLPPGVARAIATHYQVPLITEEQWRDDAFITEFGEILPWVVRPKVGERRGISNRRETGSRLMNVTALLGAVLLGVMNSWIPFMVACGVVLAMSCTYGWSWWDE